MIPRMVEIVRQEHAATRPWTTKILRDSGCPVRDEECHARAIYEWVLERFYWVNDPVLEETLLWPVRFLKEIDEHGTVLADCASVNTALVAMLGAVGIRAVFMFGGDGAVESGDPVVYHVWTGMQFGGRDYFLEPTAYLPAGKAHRWPKMFAKDPWQ